MDVGHFLDIAECRFPDKLAVVSGGRRITYRQLKDRVQRLMAGLANLGVNKGDRVGTLMWNRSELIEIYLAAIRLGAVFTPLNYRLKGPEVSFVLKDARPTLLVADENCEDLAGEVASDVPETKRLYCTTSWPKGDFQRYESLVEGNPPYGERAVLSEEEPCQLIYTSGTTGRPKGVILTHENVLWNTVNMVLARHDRPQDVALIVGPMFHTAALNSQYTSRLALGATSVIMDKFEPADFMELVQREKITVVSGTPSLFIMLMEHCSPGQYDTSSVTTVTTGSDRTPDHVKRAMVELFPNAQGIYDIYGCTECAPCITTLDKREYFIKKDSVGPPLPFVEVRLLDEKGKEVPVGQPGEIVVRGPNVMKGYFRQPEETAKVLKDEWLYTGDLARSDEDGYLTIVGRKKEIIISGGENVSAREVEDGLVSHPAVLKAAVFGLPDPKWVERVTAAVVLREGHALNKEQLLSFLRGRMAGYKIPKEIIFTDRLPESATGKVQKEVLKRKYADGGGSTGQGL